MAKTALGRGLGALLGAPPVSQGPPVFGAPAAAATTPALDQRERVEHVALTRISRCPFQPRKDFSEATLRELADSIQAQGIVQPLIVRRRGEDYELIAGERRWRAAQRLGLTEAPVIVREADDRAVLELALIENLQRENLNPIEEAQGYSQLIEQFQLTQEMAATKVGKSRAVVANALRLLKLPQAVQGALAEGRISEGHARALLALPHPQEQEAALETILKNDLNVRQTEELVRRLSGQRATPRARRAPSWSASRRPSTPCW